MPACQLRYTGNIANDVRTLAAVYDCLVALARVVTVAQFLVMRCVVLVSISLTLSAMPRLHFMTKTAPRLLLGTYHSRLP